MSSNAYGWIITVDFLADKTEPEGTNCNAPGIKGPWGIRADISLRLDSGEGHEFRMYDDDHELYYEGRYLGPNDSTMFRPLDGFGTPNAGCTEIRYKNAATGEWEQL